MKKRINAQLSLFLIFFIVTIFFSACVTVNIDDGPMARTNRTFWNVYIGVFIVGLILLVITFLTGIGEHDVDVHVGDHGFEVGHDVHIEHGGIDLDHGVDYDHDIGDHEAGPSWLSMRLILIFLVGFGAGGIIGLEALNFNGFLSLVTAFVLGFICHILGFYMLKALWKQEVSSQVSTRSLIGTEVYVVNKIKPHGIGEIKGKNVKTGGAEYVKARAENPKDSFEEGEVVVVKDVISGDCVVGKKEEG